MQEFEKKEKLAGKKMGYLCLILGIFFIILTITYIILGYFVSFEGTDGIGRVIDDVPAAMSMILPQWAGHIWFIIDCVILLAMVIIIDKLFVKSKVYFTGVKNVDF